MSSAGVVHLADQQISGGQQHEDAGQDVSRFHPGCIDTLSNSQRSTGAIPTSDNALWSATRARGSKKIMAAAEAEAVKNNWAMAIVILDSTGHMVMLHKLDNTQYGSLMAAEDKALSAINYRCPSKVFEDLVAQGGIGLRSLALRGASPLEGGIPINVDGEIVGAIGVSGGTSVQDGQVAKAGADVAK